LTDLREEKKGSDTTIQNFRVSNMMKRDYISTLTIIE